jgi:hypothetical protein
VYKIIPKISACKERSRGARKVNEENLACGAILVRLLRRKDD